MLWSSVIAVVLMFLLPAGEPPENPWKEKVPAAVRHAESEGTVPALREALDATWRGRLAGGLEVGGAGTQAPPRAGRAARDDRARLVAGRAHGGGGTPGGQNLAEDH